MSELGSPSPDDTERIEDVNTPCIGQESSPPLGSVPMAAESPSDRLRRARAAAGYKTAAEFAKAHDLTESTYRSADNGTRGLRLAAAKVYAPLLGVTWQWLMDGSAGGPSISRPQRRQDFPNHDVESREPFAIQSATVHTEAFLPVLGMAEGGSDGWNFFNGDTIGTIRRPDNLIGVAGAYAVYITGSSMEPRFQAGELAHINPHKPATPGCYVLVQKKPNSDGDTPLAVIKRLVRRSGSKVVLEQINPAKQFEIRADEIVSIHRVVGSSEG